MRVRFRHDLKIFAVILLVILGYAIPICLILRSANQFETTITASFIAAAVAMVTGILALLKDFILDIINAPSLKAEFFPYDNRDCHATQFGNGDKVHYFRIRIKNNGWRAAEDVEVTLEEVRVLLHNQYEIDKDFMPLRLFWSHWRETRYELNIPPGAYRHCDLGFVLEPGATAIGLPATINNHHQFWFDVFLRPNTGKTSLSSGQYQIIISASGKNVGQQRLTIEIKWIGGWQGTIEDLYRHNLKILSIS